MKAADIRTSFLEFFRTRGHEVRPSSSLVPEGDQTLLFTNAGMVQFKRVFLGLEEVPYRRAVTSQKCVRAGGKHNDLEEVGRTARHHTFFEMLGNFSFGDYFKRDAIDFAWEFLTGELGLDPHRLYITVHHTDEEAAALWTKVAGVPPERIYRLGDKDNFWQMADTGPCGPCSEIHYDLRPSDEWGVILETEEFETRGEAGEFLELWNLVFMQFDRDESGTLNPLPAPSIDTGAGLERLAAVLQAKDTNYHTDLFVPLLDRVAQVVGEPYRPDTGSGLSYRVLADHARAVAFLLADGVYPSNEGRGYVLRRILRRGLRHAWLLGRRDPTMVYVVEEVIETMSDVYPELDGRRDHILEATRAEERRFLDTIEGGMDRFDQIAPRREDGDSATPVIPGAEIFRLYDTFGFPVDLTELMAEERGYGVDLDGFEEALSEQRARSRADRSGSGPVMEREEKLVDWTMSDGAESQVFVGYDSVDVPTSIVGCRTVADDDVGLLLEQSPFYVESGGQVSDTGVVIGDGWKLPVTRVGAVGSAVAVFGTPEGDFPGSDVLGAGVRARVDRAVRHDTERNHTATHLLHAALRATLGDHVVQRGSLVAPDRLRFDFAHSSPSSKQELETVERLVNEAVWADHPVEIGVRSYEDAVAAGAMALFGEKYADEVRVVEVPGVSMELCGGTHVGHTGEIGLFTIVSEGGVAAGVRRIEALTGPRAFQSLERYKRRIEEMAASLKASPENLERRVGQLVSDTAALEGLVEELRKGGGGAGRVVTETEFQVHGRPATYRGVRLKALGPDDARVWGDEFLTSVEAGVAVVAAEMPDDKYALFAFVTDNVIEAGVRADSVVREVATAVGGKGGGRPHMAQAGVADPAGIDEAIRAGAEFVAAVARGASE